MARATIYSLAASGIALTASGLVGQAWAQPLRVPAAATASGAPALVIPAPALVVRPMRIARGYRRPYVINSKVTWIAASTPFVGQEPPLVYSSHLFPGRNH